jgi:hypothetical protein
MDPRVAALPRNQAKPKNQVALLCPAGCGRDKVNAVGYCSHLVGWTDPDKPGWMETRLVSETGVEGCRGKAKLRPSDIIVEMNTAYNRVYRLEEGQVAKPVDRPPPDADTQTKSMLLEILEELRAQRSDIDALKRERAPAKPEEVAEDDDDGR